MIEELNRIVQEQQPQFDQIKKQAEITVDNMNAGVKESTAAVIKARAARNKKWICLGIVGRCFLSAW